MATGLWLLPYYLLGTWDAPTSFHPDKASFGVLVISRAFLMSQPQYGEIRESDAVGKEEYSVDSTEIDHDCFGQASDQ